MSVSDSYGVMIIFIHNCYLFQTHLSVLAVVKLLPIENMIEFNHRQWKLM